MKIYLQASKTNNSEKPFTRFALKRANGIWRIGGVAASIDDTIRRALKPGQEPVKSLAVIARSIRA
jgi:hypothetical protein